MSGFSDPIIGGGGSLVYPSIHSPNFSQATQTGWSIDKNGNAFFYGIVTSGEFTGTDFIINSAGAFFYSGTPAAGNLAASISQSAGTDTFGNAWLQGITYYSFSTLLNQWFAVNNSAVLFQAIPGMSLPGVIFWTAATQAGPWTQIGELTAPSVTSVALTAGGAGSLAVSKNQGVMTGASPSGLVWSVTNTASSSSVPASQITVAAAGDFAQGIEVSGDSSNRLKIDSNGQHLWGSGSAGQDTNLYRGAANRLQTDDALAMTTLSGAASLAAGAALLYGASGGEGRVGTLDVAGNAMTVGASRTGSSASGTSGATVNIGSISIPANDITSSGVYRLNCAVQGSWGTTATSLTLTAMLGGTSLGGITIDSTVFSTSVPFRIAAHGEFICTAAGSAGAATGALEGSINQTGHNLIPGTVANNTCPFCASAGSILLNTQNANTLLIQASWSGAFGTISPGGYAYLERVA